MPQKQRERDGERKDGSADADDGFGWKGIRRKQQRQLRQPVRRSNAQDGAGAGDDDGFDEQLADDAPATGSDRTADGELMLARAATGQQKDGAIGAADDEQQHNAREKKRQGAASVLLVRHNDGLQREMPVIGKAVGMLLRKLAHDGLQRSVGGVKCDAGPELDPRYGGHEGKVESRHESARQVNIADAEAVIECEAARHDPNDGVGDVIDFERLPDDMGIATEVALPEAVVENNDGAAAILCIGWLEVAAEKRAHTKESPGILCEVDDLDVFRQCTASDLHTRFVEAKHRIDRGCKAQVIKLCLAKGKPAPIVRMLLIDDDGVHDAVGAIVGKRVQQDGVDEREHRRGGADAERE
jgi:hypothetical protein